MNRFDLNSDLDIKEHGVDVRYLYRREDDGDPNRNVELDFPVHLHENKNNDKYFRFHLDYYEFDLHSRLDINHIQKFQLDLFFLREIGDSSKYVQHINPNILHHNPHFLFNHDHNDCIDPYLYICLWIGELYFCLDPNDLKNHALPPYYDLISCHLLDNNEDIYYS